MEKTLNTIIVLRNDHGDAVKFGTAGSDVILKAGELGIHYLDNGNVVVKSGDGQSEWAKLKQIEGVFEEDQIITYDFGRHKTTNGYVNAGGAGMTMSQWLIHALSETKDPTIAQPTYSLAAGAITTNTGNNEIGSQVTKLAWDGTFTSGSYEYGSKSEDEQTKYTDTATGVTATYEMTSTNNGSLANTLDGTLTLATPIVISSTSGTSCGSITGKCNWIKSPRKPVNNVGVVVDGQIESGSDEKTVSYSVTGYREGCFYGTVDIANFTSDKITSQIVRGLQKKTGKNYASATNLAYTVPVGATAIIIAVPSGKTGPTSVLNTTVNAEMWGDNFKKVVISIGGADASQSSTGNYAIDYDVYYYIPANAYGSTAALQIDLGA